MGNLVSWKTIDSESTFNQVRIYRSTSESGTYTLIETQTDITDASYYDPNGVAGSWYKIDFYDTTNSVASTLSTAFLADTFRGYCTVEDIRNMTNISTSDVSDTGVCNLITYAGTILNSDMEIYEEEERIAYISNTKGNDINGTNTTFYCKNFPMGDLNDDFKVNTSDVNVYQYASDGTRTALTVSSVVAATGSFVLSSAPAASISHLTVTYKWAQRNVATPDALIKQAVIALVSSFAYRKINVGKSPRWRMGSTQIWRDITAHDQYYKEYNRLLARLNDRLNVDQIQLENVL